MSVRRLGARAHAEIERRARGVILEGFAGHRDGTRPPDFGALCLRARAVWRHKGASERCRRSGVEQT